MALTVSTPGSISYHSNGLSDETAPADHDVVAAVLADRRRIADEMHTNLLQRLFSLGLEATSLRCRVSDESVGRRLDAFIFELDRTITDLRRSIFGLGSVDSPPRPPQLRGPQDRVATSSMTSNRLSKEPHREDRLKWIGTVFDDRSANAPRAARPVTERSTRQ